MPGMCLVRFSDTKSYGIAITSNSQQAEGKGHLPLTPFASMKPELHQAIEFASSVDRHFRFAQTIQPQLVSMPGKMYGRHRGRLR